MGKSDLIARGIQGVTFLFAAFGGFLTGIAPPEEADAKFAVGVASFLALFMLLVVSAISRKKPSGRARKLWLAGSVAFFVGGIASASAYFLATERLTFPYPPEARLPKYVAGTQLTAAGRSFVEREEAAQRRRLSNAELVAAFGGLAMREALWEPQSISRAKLYLISLYVLLALCFAGMIFGVVEGLQGPGGPPQRKRK
jgi:hypothetical protein